MLRLHRRRQDDVGVSGGVGHPLLEHDREQVLAREAGVHARVIGVARGGVRVEDDERGDGRVVGLEQRLAEARHVDRARRRGGRSAGIATRPGLMPPKWPPVMHEQRRRRRAASRRSAPGSARIARIAAPAPPWRCSPSPSRIADGRVCAKRRPSATHALDRQAADLRPRARPATRPAAPRARASPRCGARASRDPRRPRRARRASGRARARRRCRAAARGARRSARRCRVRSGSIATTCAPAFARLEHEAPLVEVRRERVGAPQQDQPRVLEVLGVHADRAAVGGAQRRRSRRPCRSSSRGATRPSRRTAAAP